MYRGQYPDGPNLLSNVRRSSHYRPPAWAVFQRSWLLSSVGLLLSAGALLTTVWNELRAVQVTRALEEGHRSVLVPESTSVVFQENNGKLIQISGDLKIEDALEDPVYGISINAVKLKRRVQMFQWYEEAADDSRRTPIIKKVEEVSGMAAANWVHDPHDHDHLPSHATNYSYDTDWFDKRIDSDTFVNPMGHHNPEAWPLNSTITVNQRVKVGAFMLGKELKELKFDQFVPFTSDQRPLNRNIKMHAGLYFHGKDVWKPEVGDIRIQFSYAGKDGDQVTVVGRQSGREIRPFVTESGSEELLFLHQGLRTPSEVFQWERTQNDASIWVYRVVAWFALFLGLNFVNEILENLVSHHHQFIRNVLILGITSLPFSLSLCLTLLVIGCSWITFRPLTSCFLLSASAVPGVVALHRIRKRRRAGYGHLS